MFYDASHIVSNKEGRLSYSLYFNGHPALEKYNQDDLTRVLCSLEEVLVILRPNDLTYDAETLVPYAWNSGPVTHNRTVGRILRTLVDHNLVPLKKVRNESGRIRFRLKSK